MTTFMPAPRPEPLAPAADSAGTSRPWRPDRARAQPRASSPARGLPWPTPATGDRSRVSPGPGSLAAGPAGRRPEESDRRGPRPKRDGGAEVERLTGDRGKVRGDAQVALHRVVEVEVVSLGRPVAADDGWRAVER